MRKFLGTNMLALIVLFAIAQPSKSHLHGTITERNTKNAVIGASVRIANRQTLTDEKGYFSFEKISLGKYELTISSLGFTSYKELININSDEVTFEIILDPTSLFLQPLEVKAISASEKAPFAKTNLNKEEIAKNNLGQDIPFLLNQTPSVVVNSDAGNGVGYTGIRIRGSDATRINVTLNGIPYNDAESMGTFFVNLPDFVSSVNNIQVQRGVGTSSNGTGAFGATINLSTNEYNEKSYGEFNNSFGSFNTRKNTLKAGTGLIGGHFTIDARLSKISSDGYIDRATSNLQSFYVSTAYLNKKSSLRLNIFSGKEKTYQSWYGVAENLLHTDRTNNPAGSEKSGIPYENQTDNYTQTHYQLFFNHAISQKWSLQLATFLTRGKGYYEEYKANQLFVTYGLPNVGSVTETDLIRDRWLDNYFYGQTASLQWKNKGDDLTIGGGWTTYKGKHFGTIPWIQIGSVPPDYSYYNFPALKKDANIFVKWQHRLHANWTSFVDVQYRHVNHDMPGFEGNSDLKVNRSFNFLNPKMGITYHKNNWQAYLSYAMGNKEPNRNDFQSSENKQPDAETLHDIELNIERKTSNYHFGISLYYMYYYNQLVLTGQINDVGAYTRVNTPHSYRLGVELQAGIVLNPWLNIMGNLTLSSNKVNSYVEFIDNYDTGGQNEILHNKTNIAFSPSSIASATISIIPLKNMNLSFISKYVGKQYMDNSQMENRSLNPYYLQDIRANWNIKKFIFSEWNIIVQVNNIFNKKYEPNGYTYSYVSGGSQYTDNGYYPMAGTNFMLGVNLRF